ncbi:MAG: indolepyruvate ferredoxin oxidoreductase subunit alpha [Bacillota bacterium]
MDQPKKVIIDSERCKGCHLCSTVCPVEIIEMAGNINSHGYHPARVVDQQSCISCGLCAKICPDLAITVYREEKGRS